MFRLEFHELDIFIGKIRSIGGGAEKYMADLVLKAMQDDVWPQWIRHISLTDHSLKDLAALGYPYSTKYGKNSFVHLDEDVHIQSGDLLASSRIETVKGPTGTSVRIVNSSREYIYLRYGTSIMRARDPGGAAMRDALPAIKARFRTGVKDAVIKYIER